MKNKIIDRLENKAGFPNLVENLARELSGSELHSLMLAIIKRRLPESELGRLNLLKPSALAASCNLDARLLHKLEHLAYENASGFDAIELAPLLPLGTVSKLTGLDQANVLSTIRSLECASDPTVGLAIEAAKRRKSERKNSARTDLMTCQRVIRFPVPDKPGYTAHFKLLALVSAALHQGSLTAEVELLRDHLNFYLSYLERLKSAGLGTYNEPEIELSDTRVVSLLCKQGGVQKEEIRSRVRARDGESAARLLKEHGASWPADCESPETELKPFALPEHLLTQMQILKESLIGELAKQFPHVSFKFNFHRLTGLSYYQGPCFHLKVKDTRGEKYMIADGGLVDWTQNLLNNKKERLLTSAIGIELMARIFA